MTTPPQDRPPLTQAVTAQGLGVLPAVGLALLFPDLLAQPLAMAISQGLCAALISHLRRGPIWWLPIHLGFVPLALLTLRLGLPAWIWLAGFVLLLLIFWRTDRSRVPLYLTNTTAGAAIAGALPATPCNVIDLGCGDGGLLLRLARQRPDCRFTGFEHAPLTWAWAWLRCRQCSNVRIRYGDFWPHSLSGFDVVYAFLSPAPMPELWAKAQTEMADDARLISNSFEITGVAADQIIDVADRRATRLYCYKPRH